MLSEYKLTLTPKTIDSAATSVRPLLEKAQAELGFVPNMYSRMANAPGLLSTYVHGYKLFRQESGFSAVEQEVVFLAISVENNCEYCVAAHSLVADAMSKVPPAVTDAIRDRRMVPDAKLSALADFARTMVATRGQPTGRAVESFLAAGYTEQDVLQVILAVSMKTLSNYANHLFHTPIDAMFAARSWNSARAVA